MNNLDYIYQELGSDICLYPFFGAFYQTNGIYDPATGPVFNTVRPCSIIIPQHDEWNIENSSIQHSRNNTTWQQLRQDFLNGQFHCTNSCKSCSYNEQVGTTSPRQMSNQFFAQFLDFDIVDEVRSIANNNYQVTKLPSLDFYPSNYCNYSCVMCSPGASTQRLVFEIKQNQRPLQAQVNPLDADFYSVVKDVKVINLTGGETVMQPQVHELIDYLIENNLSQNIMITLLTNASDYPIKLLDKFAQFKQVIYNVSIDGTGAVIEYQRRGCDWLTVESNSLKLLKNPNIDTVINYVLTAINVFSADQFVNWLYENSIGSMSKTCITVSPVFGYDYLGQAVLPQELRDIAIDRLAVCRQHYSSIDSELAAHCVIVLDRIANVIFNTPHCPEYLPQFVEHIKKEDAVSKQRLVDVVPEWAPYFQS